MDSLSGHPERTQSRAQLGLCCVVLATHGPWAPRCDHAGLRGAVKAKNMPDSKGSVEEETCKNLKDHTAHLVSVTK